MSTALREAGPDEAGISRPVAEVRPRPPSDGRRRRAISLSLVALVLWAAWGAGSGPEGVVHPGGWPLLRRFFAAAARPELDRQFVELVVRSTFTTIAFAVVATVLAVLGGLAAGGAISALASGRGGWRWTAPLRAAMAIPRGLHEAVWALLLLSVIGRDPLVAVLAIAIPFGAITAIVFADLFAEVDARPARAARAAGAGRLASFAYATLPAAWPDVVAYGFYRFECAVRSAVVVGIIGAGGLGFQLALSFSALRYEEMWTVIYVLIGAGALVEWWSGAMRNGRGRRRPTRLTTPSLVVGGTLLVASVVHLRVDATTLWSARTGDLVARLVGESWPPRLPAGGWGELAAASAATVQMSVLAIAGALAAAVLVSPIAARTGALRGPGVALRLALLVARTIPPPVWALLTLFVVQPGAAAAAIALGVYTLGVLGRLLAEVVENADQVPGEAARAAGAGRLTSFAYGTLPLVAPRFAALGLYRWEVVVRDSVVVGLVGAGGLGRLLASQNAAFDRRAMVTTLCAFILLAAAADAVSGLARRAIR